VVAVVVEKLNCQVRQSRFFGMVSQWQSKWEKRQLVVNLYGKYRVCHKHPDQFCRLNSIFSLLPHRYNKPCGNHMGKYFSRLWKLWAVKVSLVVNEVDLVEHQVRPQVLLQQK
jgi:hypothetical protein